MDAVREALKGEDTGVIDSTKSQLAEVLQRIGTKAYEPTPEGGDGGNGAGPSGEAGAEGASEDEGETIEGEYKEV
ncbi:MAG TPA: hypothetical protein VFN76_05965, partial [Candidatus Limnocylindria bacterium]|nr:hypothetical protein [Candidatus Limnocylindria bacterium]